MLEVYARPEKAAVDEHSGSVNEVEELVSVAITEERLNGFLGVATNPHMRAFDAHPVRVDACVANLDRFAVVAPRNHRQLLHDRS